MIDEGASAEFPYRSFEFLKRYPLREKVYEHDYGEFIEKRGYKRPENIDDANKAAYNFVDAFEQSKILQQDGDFSEVMRTRGDWRDIPFKNFSISQKGENYYSNFSIGDRTRIILHAEPEKFDIGSYLRSRVEITGFIVDAVIIDGDNGSCLELLTINGSKRAFGKWDEDDFVFLLMHENGQATVSELFSKKGYSWEEEKCANDIAYQTSECLQRKYPKAQYIDVAKHRKWIENQLAKSRKT